MKTQGQIFTLCILKTFTTIFFITFSALILPQTGFPQLIDSFEDADLSANPAWSGSMSDFTTWQGQLKLDAPPVSGSSFLASESTISQQGLWEFSVQLLFNPSATNYARIYLTSDQPILNQPLQGFFVQVGSSQDDISLFRQSGSTLTRIVDGADGKLNLDEVVARIKVVSHEDGTWQLFTDLGRTGNFILEGTSLQQPLLSSSWFGLLCTYTATRADKFIFDDVSVSSTAEPDKVSPEIESAIVVSESTVSLTFSEAIDRSSASNKANYVFPDVVSQNPSEALVSADGRAVLLKSVTPFPNGMSRSVRISGVSDIAGNLIAPKEIAFVWIAPSTPGWKDIIVSEIMSDPEPIAGLPNSEYIEVYNRSDKPFNLEGWTVSDGSASGNIGKLILLPGHYAVLTPAATVSLFAEIKNVYPVSGWPSLNNSGDLIKLAGQDNVAVDSINYSSSWYKDSQKKDGGWSLEIIYPSNSCGEEDNWTASENESGGTPGTINSVDTENPDLVGPALVDAFAIDHEHVSLLFDEKLIHLLPEISSFEITPAAEISTLSLSENLAEINLMLTESMDPGVTYQVKVKNIYDCSGNVIAENSLASFVLPSEADSLDILFNEILFNPMPGGSDFIELVNTSSKNIDLRQWSVGILKEGQLTDLKVISINPLILKPGGYLAFTPDPGTVISHYPLSNLATIRTMNLPSFNDDQGTVVLVNPSGKPMDKFSFNDDWHSVFIQNTEGVSLERISFRVSSLASENWKSSTTHAGFATPGSRNSNELDPGTADSEIIVLPEVFIPVSGLPDFASIRFRLRKTGLMANIHILNSGGQLVKTLAENMLLGTDGFVRWEGDLNNGTKAPVGSYMVFVELFDGTGYVRKIRKRVAIAGQF